MNRKGIGLFIFLMLLMNSAMADWFTPASGSKGAEWLRTLFPGAFGGGADVFGGMFTILNGAALVIGGVMSAYTIFAGTMMTAHEGEMGGKAFSSMWVPIRTVVGVAALVPAASGYSGVQLFVGWMMIQGVGMGDTIAAAFTTSANLQNLAAVTQPYTKADEPARIAFLNAVCLKANEEAEKKFVELNYVNDWSVKQISANGKMIWNYGDQEKAGNECGYLQFPDEAAFYGQDGWDRFKGFFNKADYKAKIDGIRNAHIAAINELNTRALAAASAFVNSGNLDINIIHSLSAAYQAKLTSSLGLTNDAQAASDSISQAVRAGGFVELGKIGVQTTVIQNDINQAAANLPEGKTFIASNSVKAGYGYSDVKDKIESILTKSNEMGLNSSLADVNAGSENKSTWETLKDKVSVKGAILEALNSYQNFWWDKDKHVLTQLTSLGGWCFLISGALAVGALLLGATTSGAAAVLLVPFVITFFTLGITLTYILPLLPFLAYFGGIVGWLVLCVEAMVAAPIGFMMIMNPHANHLLGSSSQALKLVVSVTLRPALMVFGFATFLIMTDFLGKYLISDFGNIFNSSQADSNIATAIAGKLISPIIATVIFYQYYKMALPIIHKVPDGILTWLGAGAGNQLGSFSEGGIAKGAAVGAASGAAMGALGQAAQGLAQLKGKKDEGDSPIGGGSPLPLKSNQNDDPMSQQKSRNEESAKNAQHAESLSAAFGNEGIQDNFAQNRENQEPAEAAESMYEQAVSSGNERFGSNFEALAEKYAVNPDGSKNLRSLASLGANFSKLEGSMKKLGKSDDSIKSEIGNTANSLLDSKYAPEMSNVIEKVQSRIGKYESQAKLDSQTSQTNEAAAPAAESNALVQEAPEPADNYNNQDDLQARIDSGEVKW